MRLDLSIKNIFYIRNIFNEGKEAREITKKQKHIMSISFVTICFYFYLLFFVASSSRFIASLFCVLCGWDFFFFPTPVFRFAIALLYTIFIWTTKAFYFHRYKCTAINIASMPIKKPKENIMTSLDSGSPFINHTMQFTKIRTITTLVT